MTTEAPSIFAGASSTCLRCQERTDVTSSLRIEDRRPFGCTGVQSWRRRSPRKRLYQIHSTNLSLNASCTGRVALHRQQHDSLCDEVQVDNVYGGRHSLNEGIMHTVVVMFGEMRALVCGYGVNGASQGGTRQACFLNGLAKVLELVCSMPHVREGLVDAGAKSVFAFHLGNLVLGPPCIHTACSC